MNLSKLQSEAVKEFNRLEMDDDDGCAVCLGEMMSLVNLKLLKDFLTDQIQKAYKAGIKEVLRNVEYNAQTKIWEIPEEKLLSIQSKEK